MVPGETADDDDDDQARGIMLAVSLQQGHGSSWRGAGSKKPATPFALFFFFFFFFVSSLPSLPFYFRTL